MKVYIVYCCSGLYDDYFEENLEIFSSLESANKYAEKINNRLKELGVHKSQFDISKADREYYGKEYDIYHSHEFSFTISSGAEIKVSAPFELRD